MKLSIIIPAYNEADNIETTLQALQKYRPLGHQIIVADGGSTDNTLALAAPLADLVFSAPKGRARQMNAAAEKAEGDTLLFLHADTQLPKTALALIEDALQGKKWGRFDIRLSGQASLLRLVEFMINLRSRLSGIATGDQAIFVSRHLFEKIDGYQDIPLMEDIALSRSLKQHGSPACLRTPLITSSRRWEQYGILKTIVLMWRLRLGYWLGIAPETLIKQYK